MNSYLQHCADILERATANLAPDAATRRIGERWSIVEIVEHLQRTYSATAKGLERAVEQGSGTAGTPTIRQALSTFVVVNLGYFPAGRTAPRHVLPTGELNLDVVLERAAGDLVRLDSAAERARGALGRVKMLNHPIMGPFTVDEWLKFHWVHTRHHEKQIVALRQGVGTVR